MPPSKVCSQWHKLMARRVLHFSAFILHVPSLALHHNYIINSKTSTFPISSLVLTLFNILMLFNSCSIVVVVPLVMLVIVVSQVPPVCWLSTSSGMFPLVLGCHGFSSPSGSAGSIGYHGFLNQEN